MLRFDDTYCARQVGVRVGNTLQESSPCRINLQCRVSLQRLGEVGSPKTRVHLSCNVRWNNAEWSSTYAQNHVPFASRSKNAVVSRL